MLTDFPQQAPWGRARGRSSGEHSFEIRGEGVQVNCSRCRAQMCTDDLLSKLRCAECRQVEFDRIFELCVRTSLLALGVTFVWLLVSHRTSPESDQVVRETRGHLRDRPGAGREVNLDSTGASFRVAS